MTTRSKRIRLTSPTGLMASIALLAVLAILFAFNQLALDDATKSEPGPGGTFAYYVLALSWSPSYCASKGRAKGERQCTGRRPYSFVLHGLWPQYETNWPQFCRTGKSAFVPESIIQAMLDIMPARRLVIHQYRKHGTCSGLAPKAYFDTARRLFESIKIPARYTAPRDFMSLPRQQIEADFIAANVLLEADGIAIACGQGRRLTDVRICFSKDLKPRTCGANENQSRLCRLPRVMLPPVRAH